jgi:hypothetical protein
MPLIQGASVDSAKKNYSLLLNEGKKKSQAYAIAVSIALKNRKRVSYRRQREIIEGNLFG